MLLLICLILISARHYPFRIVKRLLNCRMELGVAHFEKVLKKAYELPLTGMSVSLIYSLSHAHIEGAAQIRRFGKAEGTVMKLKEIAEVAQEKPIPHAIPTVADQLHLWWREKAANLFSRQVLHRVLPTV